MSDPINLERLRKEAKAASVWLPCSDARTKDTEVHLDQHQAAGGPAADRTKWMIRETRANISKT
jgi:hypothetical protein